MECSLKAKLQGGCFKNVSKTRSQIMSSIRGKRNKSTEGRLRFVLVRRVVNGWILNPSSFPGKPDFLFPKGKLAVFVDGCFWHGCARCGHLPKTRKGFWQAKLAANKRRDRRVAANLRKSGFSVMRIWEHELVAANSLARIVRRIKNLLNT
jgi:DNA mismatch endonuclease (patch repair protein)